MPMSERCVSPNSSTAHPGGSVAAPASAVFPPGGHRRDTISMATSSGPRPTWAPPPDSWPRCQAGEGADCEGIRALPFDRCLAHLATIELDGVLSTLRPGVDIDVRGVPFTGDLLARILDVMSDDERVPRFGTARFDGARFAEDAEFDRARFSGEAVFRRARFGGEARFGAAQFRRRAWFAGAGFVGMAWFGSARFGGDAGFGTACFKQDAWFPDAHISRTAWFDRARFTGNAGFERAHFGGDACFDGAHFKKDAGFNSAEFKAAQQLGPIVVHGHFALDNALFERPVQIEAVAGEVTVRQVEFGAAATMRLRYADTVLDGMTTTQSVTIAGAAGPFTFLPRPSGEPLQVDESVLAASGSDAAPALRSLRRVDASLLVLINCNLSRCEFTDANQLDQVRIVGRPRLASTPRGWVWKVSWPPVGYWTSRQALAEELIWRADEEVPAGPWRRHADNMDLPRRSFLTPARVSALYRQLRKAEEDAKNEPGAADLYYGETEMRRLDRATPRFERLTLTLYWLLSGYGLRAARAFVALLVLLVLGTVGFATMGLANSNHVKYQPIDQSPAGEPAAYQQVNVPGPRPGWTAALDQSINSATSLLHAPPSEQLLTPAGRAMEIVLRLLGPLLLGLVVLAVRNRVKR
jgi:hypothetical protein